MTVGGGPLLLGGVFQVKMSVFRIGELRVHIFPAKEWFFADFLLFYTSFIMFFVFLLRFYSVFRVLRPKIAFFQLFLREVLESGPGGARSCWGVFSR